MFWLRIRFLASWVPEETMVEGNKCSEASGIDQKAEAVPSEDRRDLTIAPQTGSPPENHLARRRCESIIGCSFGCQMDR